MAQLTAADLEREQRRHLRGDDNGPKWTTQTGTGSDQVLRVALVEAVLVHVRLLGEFPGQTSANAHPNDATANHCLPTWSPGRQDTIGQRRRGAHDR